MAQPISDEQWKAIDNNIVADLNLPAIKKIRALSGVRLIEAIKIFYERYAKLRAESPGRFNCSECDC